jgi:DnaJ-class molecular chaperone
MDYQQKGDLLKVTEYEHCPKCNGTGRERIWNNENMDVRICKTCDGRGKYLDETYLLAPESNVWLNHKTHYDA